MRWRSRLWVLGSMWIYPLARLLAKLRVGQDWRASKCLSINSHSRVSSGRMRRQERREFLSPSSSPSRVGCALLHRRRLNVLWRSLLEKSPKAMTSSEGMPLGPNAHCAVLHSPMLRLSSSDGDSTSSESDHGEVGGDPG